MEILSGKLENGDTKILKKMFKNVIKLCFKDDKEFSVQSIVKNIWIVKIGSKKSGKKSYRSVKIEF